MLFRSRCLIVFWCEGAWSKSCWVFVWSRSCHELVQCFIVFAEAGSLVFGIGWALEDVVLRRFGGGVLQAGWGCLLWIEGILQVRLQPLGSYECLEARGRSVLQQGNASAGIISEWRTRLGSVCRKAKSRAPKSHRCGSKWRNAQSAHSARSGLSALRRRFGMPGPAACPTGLFARQARAALSTRAAAPQQRSAPRAAHATNRVTAVGHALADWRLEPAP